MPTRNITCLNCHNVGMLDVHHVNDVVPQGHLFRHLGHNPYSGDLHYQCPVCRIVLLVDPIAALGEMPLNGFPGERAELPSRQLNNRSMWRDFFRSFSQEEIRT